MRKGLDQGLIIVGPLEEGHDQMTSLMLLNHYQVLLVVYAHIGIP